MNRIDITATFIRRNVIRTVFLLLTCLACVSCSILDSDSEVTTPSFDRNQTLTFAPIENGAAQRITFSDPSIFQSPLFGLALEDCSKPLENSTIGASLAGKARQLFISMDALKILERRTIDSEHQIVSIRATAEVETTPLALIAYTWSTDECLHDFLVWSKDVSLVTSEASSEHIALAILDRYVIATVQSFIS